MSEARSALQREIDAIDRALHDLILRRAVLAREAGERRRIVGRLAEDVSTIRTLAARHQGEVPFAAVVRVWRELASRDAAKVCLLGAEDPVTFCELARSQFGGQAVIQRLGTPSAILERVAADADCCGVLPAGSEERWWLRLMSETAGTPRIVARLPWPEEGAPLAYVVAAEPMAATSDDRSLLAIETHSDVSPRVMEKVLAGVGLEGALVDRAQSGLAVYFYEIAGYVAPGDARLAILGAPVLRAHIIGTHPAPIAAAPTPKPDRRSELGSTSVLPFPARTQ